MKPLIIWTYHRILPEESDATVKASIFDQQITFLKEQNYQFITTSGLRQWFAGELDPGERYTMLSFDDGWSDNLLHAQPILEKHNVPAVLAVNTGLLNTEDHTGGTDVVTSKKALPAAAYGRDRSSFLSWQQLKQMQASGLWDFQAHGNSHVGCYQSLDPIRGFYPDKWHWTMEHALGEPPFTGAPRAEFVSSLSSPATRLADDLVAELKKAVSDIDRFELCRRHAQPILTIETEEEFHSRVKQDLLTCKQLMEENLGVTPDCFFWPWGHSSELSRQIAGECGFYLQFTMEKDIVRPDSQKNRLPRIAAPMSLARLKKQTHVFSSTVMRTIRNMFK